MVSWVMGELAIAAAAGRHHIQHATAGPRRAQRLMRRTGHARRELKAGSVGDVGGGPMPIGALKQYHAGGAEPGSSVIDRLAAEAQRAAHKQHRQASSGADRRSRGGRGCAFGSAQSRRAAARRELLLLGAGRGVMAAPLLGERRTTALGMYPGRKAAGGGGMSTRRARGRAPPPSSSSLTVVHGARASPFDHLSPAVCAAVLARLPRADLLRVSGCCRAARVAAATALGKRRPAQLAPAAGGGGSPRPSDHEQEEGLETVAVVAAAVSPDGR
jgi:hypothetical protein